MCLSNQDFLVSSIILALLFFQVLLLLATIVDSVINSAESLVGVSNQEKGYVQNKHQFSTFCKSTSYNHTINYTSSLKDIHIFHYRQKKLK